MKEKQKKFNVSFVNKCRQRVLKKIAVDTRFLLPFSTIHNQLCNLFYCLWRPNIALKPLYRWLRYKSDFD